MTTNDESTTKIGPVVAEIFGGICQFCPLFAKIPQNPFLDSKVTEPIFTIFSHHRA